MSFDISKIKNKEDKSLISDAIKLCENKFYRASYIMAWLSCAESLKRRFYELGGRDSEAGSLYRKIKELEKQHQSVDHELIEGAYKFNLISDTEKEKLLHFFSMRSVYSHPYEEAPSEIDCHQIIESVIEIVLLRPILLKEGGISFILGRLTKEKSFLNDSVEEIKNYVSEIIPLIDPKKYDYMCEKYLKFLESMTKDQYTDILFKRGIYFIRKFVEQVRIKNIWNDEEFENILYTYRNSTLRIFATLDIFKDLSTKYQSIIINRLQEDSENNLSLMKYLDNIFSQSLMNRNQSSNYLKVIQEFSWEQLNSIGLSIKSMYKRLIQDLKSYNWYRQNPACQYMKNYPLFLADDELTDDEFIELGRNILQSYDGSSSAAGELLEDLSKIGGTPIALIQGIIEECFYDNHKKLRLKIPNPQLISQVIDNNLSTENQENLFLEISTTIQANEIKRDWNWYEYNKIPDTGFLGNIKKVLDANHPVLPF